ncbi:hypothetical protein NU195Hw_Modified_298t1 [Hortaea werneckii]
MVRVKSRAPEPSANRIKVESKGSKPDPSKIKKESKEQQPQLTAIKGERNSSESSTARSSPAKRLKSETPSHLETTTPRGRPQARKTSSTRVSHQAQANKVRRQDRRRRRDPLTPTTQSAISKERKFRRMLRQREREAEMEKVLRREETYFRVLRSGRRWRVLGGARAR